MAIFYEKIKGCSIETTGNNSEQKDLWTFLKWGSASGLKTHTIENFRIQFIPSLIVSGSGGTVKSETDKSVYDFGRFIVSGEKQKDFTDKGNTYFGQYLYTDLCINESNTLFLNKIESVNESSAIHFNDCASISKDTINFHVPEDKSQLTFCLQDKDQSDFLNIKTTGTTNSITSNAQTITFQNVGTCSFVEMDNHYGPAPFSFTGDISVTGSLTSTSKIEALYFNATSDSRAKTILGKVPNALSTIVDTPIYEYFYTDDAKKTELIGILAQDLLKNGDEFHIVNNQSATGVNGDFMTIKEDRLTFVLWKALQELTEEVKELRNEVNELRGGK